MPFNNVKKIVIFLNGQFFFQITKVDHTICRLCPSISPNTINCSFSIQLERLSSFCKFSLNDVVHEIPQTISFSHNFLKTFLLFINFSSSSTVSKSRKHPEKDPTNVVTYLNSVVACAKNQIFNLLSCYYLWRLLCHTKIFLVPQKLLDIPYQVVHLVIHQSIL